MAQAKSIDPQDLKELNDIAHTVEMVTNISAKKFRGKHRYKQIVNARFMFIVVAYRLKENWQGGRTKILARYLNRDHASIIHGYREGLNRIEYEPQFRQQFEMCLEKQYYVETDEDRVNNLTEKVKMLQRELAIKDQIVFDLHQAVKKWREKAEANERKGLPLFG